MIYKTHDGHYNSELFINEEMDGKGIFYQIIDIKLNVKKVFLFQSNI